MASTPKITTGANDRPRDETIAQSGPGLPDDTGRAPEVDEAEVERMREKLVGPGDTISASTVPEASGSGDANPDAVPAGTPGAAENICRRCAGTGKAEGGPCPDCGGSGTVLTPVGGAG